MAYLVRYTRTPTSPRSLGFCAIWDSISSSNTHPQLPQAFGALRSKIFSSRDISERLKGKVYAGGVLAVLLYGCESWCLTAESVRRLANWHNKRIREMCRVTMLQTYVYRITSESLQKRTGVFSLEHYLASRTLLWATRTASPNASCSRGSRSLASLAAKK